MLSSFIIRPQVGPNLCEFLSSVYHKRRYSEEPNSCWLKLTSMVGKNILWKSMAAIRSLVTSILQNIFFCVQQQKESHTGLDQLEGESIVISE